MASSFLCPGLVNDSVLVEMRLDGYESASSEVALGVAAPDPLEFVLAPTVRKFELQTSPSGASVRLDGKPLEGVTPLSIELPPDGEHEIAFTKAEHQTATIRIGGGEPFPAEPVVLTPLGKPGTVAVDSTYPVSVRRGTSELVPATPSPSVQLRPGSYELRLIAESVFLDRVVPAQVREGETTSRFGAAARTGQRSSQSRQLHAHHQRNLRGRSASHEPGNRRRLARVRLHLAGRRQRRAAGRSPGREAKLCHRSKALSP